MALFGKKNKKSEGEKAEIKKEHKIAGEGVEKESHMPSTPLPKGGDAQAWQIILRPHVTEKGSLLGEQNKYVFKVANDANKIEIKKAIQSLYKVGVEKVHVLKAKSKFRQLGKHEGRKPGFKKAIVTLKEGSRIEITS